MAGNQTVYRREAQNAYNEAKKNGAKKKDLDVLFATYEAKQQEENDACDTGHKAKR